MYFSLFHNYFPFEKCWGLHLNKVDIPFTIGLLALEKKIIIDIVNVFLLFHNYLPLEKGGALHLTKLESSSLKYAMCQVWLKLAQWFWRKRCLRQG